MVENLGPRNKNLDESIFESETHMREVLDVILNKSYTKLGLQNSKGKTYEGMLTVNSIQKAQHYYDLLKKVKEGNDTLKINEKIHKAMPDFPKFAITYSVTENEEASQVNQEKMKQSLWITMKCLVQTTLSTEYRLTIIISMTGWHVKKVNTFPEMNNSI